MERAVPTGFRRTAFYYVLAACTVIVFVANFSHRNQQGIFYLWHLPLAQQVIHGHGYTYPSDASAALHAAPAHLQAGLQECIGRGQTFGEDQGKPATYPVWGYALLLAPILLVGLDPTYWILVLQGAMCVISVWFLYRAYGLEERLWQVVLLLPWIVLFSVRWPDGVVAFLFCAAVYLFQRLRVGPHTGLFIAAAVALSLMPVFRSEYVWLWIGLAFMLPVLLPIRPGGLSRMAWSCLLFCVVGISIYAPWVAHVSNDERVRLTATNSGTVLYISLGQLPDNPWGRQHLDMEAFDYTRSHGVGNALGPAGDELLARQFVADVRAYPRAFVRKALWNLNRAIDGAFYAGEYESPAHGEPSLSARVADVVRWFFGKTYSAYRWVYRVGEVCLLVLIIVPSVRRSTSAWRTAIALTGLLLLFKLAVQSLAQYEPRHMQILWLPLVIPVLKWLPPFLAWGRARFSGSIPSPGALGS